MRKAHLFLNAVGIPSKRSGVKVKMRDGELPQERKSKQRRKSTGSGILVRFGASENVVMLITIKRESEDSTKFLD
jgi:hypothetical protein